MPKLSKEERIKREISRLLEIFSDLDTNTMSLIEGLIKRAAYMRVTLEDYEADMDANGSVELFSQSAQASPYERERPVSKLHNNMSKNYQSIMTRLLDALPSRVSCDISDDILRFASGAK